MSAGLEVALVLLIFLGLLAAGMAIPFAIGVPAIVYLLLHGGVPALKGIGLMSWGSMNSFALTAIPLFILMAEIMQHSGLSFRIYRGLSRLVCVIPGGLLQTNIAGCALFAAISGSSVATAAAIGKPMVLSTGMATMEEIARAVDLIDRNLPARNALEDMLALLDRAPHRVELAGEVGDPVGFLVPDVGHVADRGRPLREQGDDGERRHRVADRVHVDVDAARRTAGHGHRPLPLLAPGDNAAHPLERVCEGHVSLHTAA